MAAKTTTRNWDFNFVVKIRPSFRSERRQTFPHIVWMVLCGNASIVHKVSIETRLLNSQPLLQIAAQPLFWLEIVISISMAEIYSLLKLIAHLLYLRCFYYNKSANQFINNINMNESLIATSLFHVFSIRMKFQTSHWTHKPVSSPVPCNNLWCYFNHAGYEKLCALGWLKKAWNGNFYFNRKASSFSTSANICCWKRYEDVNSIHIPFPIRFNLLHAYQSIEFYWRYFIV